MNASEPAIAAIGLVKSYGPTGVLRGLDLRARRGEVLTVFGPNGAGKTTLLRILATLTKPDAGAARVSGHDVAKEGELVRQTTGVLMHSPMLYGDMTARENLLFFGRMFRIQNVAARVAAAAELAQVTPRLDDRVRTLSHGFQKRVALARALLHDPQMLLLDEPESGLDQSALRLLDRLLDDYRASGRTVVMTTHALERGLEVSDRVVVITRGKAVFERERSAVDAAAVREALGQQGGAGQ